jgi:hypothetical protein
MDNVLYAIPHRPRRTGQLSCPGWRKERYPLHAMIARNKSRFHSVTEMGSAIFARNHRNPGRVPVSYRAKLHGRAFRPKLPNRRINLHHKHPRSPLHLERDNLTSGWFLLRHAAALCRRSVAWFRTAAYRQTIASEKYGQNKQRKVDAGRPQMRQKLQPARLRALGGIMSESWAPLNRNRWATSSESANGGTQLDNGR